MNTFKNYGCPKGAPGAMGVDYAQLEKTFLCYASVHGEKRRDLAWRETRATRGNRI